jgi:hypothetical protein
MPLEIQKFFVLTLPAAVSIIYQVIRDWQVLIAGMLVVGALHYYHAAVIRAVRDMKDAVSRSARQAVDESNRALRREVMDLKAQLTYQPWQETNPKTQQPRQAASGDVRIRLDALRRSLRLVLGELSVSGGAVKDKLPAVYNRVALHDFDDLDPNMFEKGVGEALGKLQAALTELKKQPIEETGGTPIWDSLVQINRLAKHLESKLATNATAQTVPASMARAE